MLTPPPGVLAVESGPLDVARVLAHTASGSVERKVKANQHLGNGEMETEWFARQTSAAAFPPGLHNPERCGGAVDYRRSAWTGQRQINPPPSYGHGAGRATPLG